MDADMKMPDPQAFATSWMSQFSDPGAWQQWMKMPEMNVQAANPLAPLLKDFGAGIAPSRLEEIRADYLQKATGLWQDFMSAKTPELKDRRFSAPEWTSNPVSAFSAASYLLNSEFMMALADAVENS